MLFLLGIPILGLLVFIHELGHFLAAKACSIPVEAFSIGFGTPLLRKKIGETEYRISPIPFGGYVKMIGETPDDDRKNGFSDHPVWQRALVAVAGPLFNILSALLFFTIINMTGITEYDFNTDTTVGYVSSTGPTHSLMQQGDSILAINGAPVASWKEINRRFSRFEDSYRVTFLRDGDTQSVSFSLPLPDDETLQSEGSGLSPAYPVVIGGFSTETSPAARNSKITTGDTITAVNGTVITSPAAVINLMQNYDSAAGPVQLTLAGEKGQRTASIRPVFNDSLDQYLLGVTFQSPAHTEITLSLPAAVGKSFEDARRITATLLSFLSPRKILFTLRYSSGPVGIMQISGSAVQAGLAPTLQLMAFLSINLAVINLLPLAITDGGVLAFLLVEQVRGRPVSARKQEALTRVFAALLISLFVFITIKDIINIPAMNRLLQ
ncbi:MAG: RIP metalloprotease RseP [Fibrobacterota bacterium]